LAETLLIVGLGNPEEKYRYTRHNWGYLVVEELMTVWGLTARHDASVNGLVAKKEKDGVIYYLLRPLTYMNLSGAAVSALVKNKNIALKNILVVCDDLDLPFGQIRLRAKGSAGGHNGLKSIINTLGSMEFPRLRGGIGRPGDRDQTVDFVLDRFSGPEKKQLPDYLKAAVECCESWMTLGVDEAMSQFNKRKNDE
jgi:PTH1 family peptidyl-tRNA hydrolase